MDRASNGARSEGGNKNKPRRRRDRCHQFKLGRAVFYILRELCPDRGIKAKKLMTLFLTGRHSGGSFDAHFFSFLKVSFISRPKAKKSQGITITTHAAVAPPAFEYANRPWTLTHSGILPPKGEQKSVIEKLEKKRWKRLENEGIFFSLLSTDYIFAMRSLRTF